jgi:hypothetical protein
MSISVSGRNNVTNVFVSQRRDPQVVIPREFDLSHPQAPTQYLHPRDAPHPCELAIPMTWIRSSPYGNRVLTSSRRFGSSSTVIASKKSTP